MSTRKNFDAEKLLSPKFAKSIEKNEEFTCSNLPVDIFKIDVASFLSENVDPQMPFRQIDRNTTTSRYSNASNGIKKTMNTYSKNNVQDSIKSHGYSKFGFSKN